MPDSLARNTPLQLLPPRLEAFRHRIAALVWQPVSTLAVEGSAVLAAPIDLAHARRLPLRPVPSGERFAPPAGPDAWRQRWFRLRLPGKTEATHLHFTCGGEHTLWHRDTPWAGIDLRHPWCPLPPGGGEVWIDTGCYMTGIAGEVGVALRTGDVLPPPDDLGLHFVSATLRRRDENAWTALWRFDALWQLCRMWLDDIGWYDRGQWRTPRLPIDRAHVLLRPTLRALAQAADAWDAAGGGQPGLAALRRPLAAALRHARAASWQPRMALVGHAHIDAPFLWPVDEAKRKAVHTAATAVRLCEADPRFRFSMSQPLLWEGIRHRAPDLFQRIQKLVTAGRWEAMGGGWVEADTQIPCGEALARNLLLGRDYLAKINGGRPGRVLWLPDCFGFSACLPSVMRQVGLDGFFSVKMFWSQLTTFPHHSWVWRGPDGAEVLGHCLGTGDYSLDLDLAQSRLQSQEYAQGDVAPEILAPIGHGDGGGGPTEEHLARAALAADLAEVPRARWSTVEGFFSRLRRSTDRLPVWDGEMHLERHQGTWTHQRRLKAAYRAAELALQAHEAARAVRGLGPVDDESWQTLCEHQFHDLLAGTTIAIAIAEGESRLAALAAAQRAAAARTLGGDGWWNPLPVARNVLLPDGSAVSRFPALGAASGIVPAPAWKISSRLLAHDRVEAAFTADGRLRSLAIDGAPLPLSAPVGLELAPNPTWEYDAWELHRENASLARPVPGDALRIVARSAVSVTLASRVILGGSTGELRWTLVAGEPWLRWELRLDWKERHQLVRLTVPTSTRGRRARFGGPFGSVSRPCVPSDLRSEGLWESCASRWAAATDEGDAGGVALVAEAGWGFGVREGILHHTLVRGSTSPDPDADLGTHVIRGALGRHQADGPDATALAAETLFAPLVPGSAPGPDLVWQDMGTLTPSWTLGHADGGLVVRVHETAGRSGTARLTASARRVTLIDLGGRRLGQATRRAGVWEIPYTANQILGLHFSD